MSAMHGYRWVDLGQPHAPLIQTSADGTMLIRAGEALRPYAVRLTDRLQHWAHERPDTVCVAQRDDNGHWRERTYGQMLARVRSIAAALATRELSAERPIMIWSGNDIEQLELTLGAMWAGIPIAPVSPAYALVSTDFGKLRYLVELMTPGMVFVNHLEPFARAIDSVLPADIELVAVRGHATRAYTPFAMLASEDVARADAAHAAVGADTIAKFLFTSGSTSQPKAVPNTQRMLCSNQQMLLQTFPFVAEHPPVLVDWLPWHHTFGGNHNLNLVLYNGGTLYIDEGKPTPSLIGRTLQNLREIAPTIYFNVPKGWEDLALAMRDDHQLRDRFFSRVEMLFYAAAGLSQSIWNMIDAHAVASVGQKIRMLAGLGMTETAPSAMFCASIEARSGEVGLPCPGVETKLVPAQGKMELRFRGPNVMAGYWRLPGLNQECFDEEGYLRTGDALKPIDAAKPERGFLFDGRLAEDFKLSTGTFVSVGPLRARLIAAGAPYIQDVVLAGINRDSIVALIFPRPDVCLQLAEQTLGHAPAALADALQIEAVRQVFDTALVQFNQAGSGSASRIERAVLLAEPPSLDRGEITDKGSINQRAVLACRSALIDAIYEGRAEGMLGVPCVEMRR